MPQEPSASSRGGGSLSPELPDKGSGRCHRQEGLGLHRTLDPGAPFTGHYVPSRAAQWPPNSGHRPALWHFPDLRGRRLRGLGEPQRPDPTTSQSTKDYEKGFWTRPVAKGKPFRLMPRCVITQSSQKHGVIDNADTGGQSSLSSLNAFRPAHHVGAVAASMSECVARTAPDRRRACMRGGVVETRPLAASLQARRSRGSQTAGPTLAHVL